MLSAWLEHRSERSQAKHVRDWARHHRLAPFYIDDAKPRDVYIPLELGNVVIDLQPRIKQSIHVAIGGTSGLGKSTCVEQLLSLPIGVLIIALDNTLPLTTMVRRIPEGVEWSNEPGCGRPWHMLSGEPALVSEGLIAGWPGSEGDSGHYRRIVRMHLWDRLEQADYDGEVRSLPMLIEALANPPRSSDGLVARACRDWGTKLASMYRMMGDSIGGPGDLDLVKSMQTGRKVLMRLNRFINPHDAPTLGGMILVHARRVAQESNVPFIIILEEAGQMGNHKEQIIPLAQAGRDRDVPIVIINQNMSEMPPEVTNNISVWISFAQENRRELEFAAHHLRLDKKQLFREAFPGKGDQQGRGWAYVRAPGLKTHLVKIHKRDVKVLKSNGELAVPFAVPNTWRDPLPAIDGWRAWTPALPSASVSKPVSEIPGWVGLDADMLRWWEDMKRVGKPMPLWTPERGTWWDEKGCLEWMGPLSKHRGETLLGRPRSNRGKASVTVYIETKKAWAIWQGLDPIASVEPTLDHACDHRICVDPEHTVATSIAANNANRPIRQQMLERAWMDRYGQIPNWWSDRYVTRIT